MLFFNFLQDHLTTSLSRPRNLYCHHKRLHTVSTIQNIFLRINHILLLIYLSIPMLFMSFCCDLPQPSNTLSITSNNRFLSLEKNWIHYQIIWKQWLTTALIYHNFYILSQVRSMDECSGRNSSFSFPWFPIWRPGNNSIIFLPFLIVGIKFEWIN